MNSSLFNCEQFSFKSWTNFAQTDRSSFYNSVALYTYFTTVLRTATETAHWPATSGPKGQAVSGLAGDVAGEGGLSVCAHRPAQRAEHRLHWAWMGGGRGIVKAVFHCLSNKTTWVAETTAVEVRWNDTNSRLNCAVFQGNSRSNCVARQQQIKLLCSKATADQTAVFHSNNLSNCVPRQHQIKLLCSKATADRTVVFQGNSWSNCCVPRQQHIKLLCSTATTYQTAVFQGNNTSNCCVPRQQHIKLLCCKATADGCLELICSAENTTERIWQRWVRSRIPTCWRRWAGTWDLVSSARTSQGWWSYHCLHSTCNPALMLCPHLCKIQQQN